MTRARWTVLVAVIAFVAALAGVVVGRMLTAHRGDELHTLLHDELTLTPQQQSGIDALEARFATRRRMLEMQMRADNARLAEAMAVEHDLGPRVTAAVDASHHTMGALQKATLAHVFAMRRLLRADQTPAFDRAVGRALTTDHR